MSKRFNYQHFLEKVSVRQIFCIWMATIIISGIAYFLLQMYTPNSLVSLKGDTFTGITGLFNAIYFSFITATSTGYGDIVPLGIARLIALGEVVVGLLLFGSLISKFVSAKQELILQEIYDISFDEKINRIRSALYLFRSDANKIIDKIENSTISPRRISDLWITFTTLENSMHEIIKVIRPQKNHSYIKHIDELNLELLLDSISLSLKKACDLFTILDDKQLNWRNDTLTSILTAIEINLNEIASLLKKKELNKKLLDKLDEMISMTQQLKLQKTPKITVSASAD